MDETQHQTATVIGGSGFLGSHVADQLSIAGTRVRIFDRVASPWKRDDQQMVVGDLSDIERLNSAVAGSDVVYNFAALADLNQARSRPLDTIQVNILGNAQRNKDVIDGKIDIVDNLDKTKKRSKRKEKPYEQGISHLGKITLKVF